MTFSQQPNTDDLYTTAKNRWRVHNMEAPTKFTQRSSTYGVYTTVKHYGIYTTVKHLRRLHNGQALRRFKNHQTGIIINISTATQHHRRRSHSSIDDIATPVKPGQRIHGGSQKLLLLNRLYQELVVLQGSFLGGRASAMVHQPPNTEYGQKDAFRIRY